MTPEKGFKPRENRGTDNPLAPNRASADTRTGMQARCMNDLDPSRDAVSGVRHLCAQALRVNRVGRFGFWLSYPYFWFRMWRLVRKFYSIQRGAARSWRTVYAARRNTKGFYCDGEEFKAASRSARQLRSDVQSSRQYDDALDQLFPMHVRRLRASKDEIVRYCDYIIATIPEADPASVARAEQQQQRGELVDFETFANDLLGVQH
jgi:hypothetical protein